MRHTPHTKKILVSLMFFVVLFFGTTTPTGTHYAHAQLGNILQNIGGGLLNDVVGGLFPSLGGGGGNGVEIVLDTSPTSVARTIMDTEQKIKEQVLDPLFWNLSNNTIANMIDTLMSWVNDTDGNGTPAFITDFEKEIQDAEDEAALKFLNNAGADEMCQSFSVDVRAALTAGYAAERNNDDADIQRQECRLEETTQDEAASRDDFNRAGWGGFFTLTMDTYSDPVNAYYAEKQVLDGKTNDAKQREIAEAIANGMVKSTEECEAYDVNGLGINCRVTTPGSIIQGQIVNTLNLPGLRAAFANELDQTVGAFLGQFANQAVSGVGGLLGLSENTGFGDNGDQTYLQALTQETSEGIAGANTQATLQSAITDQFEYASILVETIEQIDDMETQIDNATEEYPGCFDVTLPGALSDARDAANERATEAGARVEALIQVYERLIDPNITDAERAQIAVEVGTFDAQLGNQMASAIATAQNDLDVVLAALLEALQEEIDDKITECGGTPDTDDTTASSTEDTIFLTS